MLWEIKNYIYSRLLLCSFLRISISLLFLKKTSKTQIITLKLLFYTCIYGELSVIFYLLLCILSGLSSFLYHLSCLINSRKKCPWFYFPIGVYGIAETFYQVWKHFRVAHIWNGIVSDLFLWVVFIVICISIES